MCNRSQQPRKYAGVLLRGSGASGDFRSQKALSWTEDRQAAKHKCLVSGCFPSLTRVTGHASVRDEGLLSADAPEPFAEHRWIMPGYSKGCGAMTRVPSRQLDVYR